MGKAWPLSLSTIQNIMKIAIFKMMALHDTLVCDSENWSTDQPFPVVSLFLCLGAKLYTCYIGALVSVIKFY